MIQLENRHCTLCGPDAGKKVRFEPNFDAGDLNAEVFSARRQVDRRHFRFVECSDCGIVYSDPACDPSRLASLYEESKVTYGSQEAQIYDSYAPVLDRALPKVRKRGTFLEIGGGSGFMLRYGAENGFAEQIEIEPSADAEKAFRPSSPKARFIRGIFKRGMLPAGSVSMVCFFQMLDHVPDPLDFLRAVHEVLEPGGVAVCVTHNTQAVSARVLRERSPIYDIEHTYLFNPGNMSRLFQRAGFKEMDGFTVANRYALRYWLNLAPLPGKFKSPLLSAFETVGIADKRVNLRAGNFGMIGTKA